MAISPINQVKLLPPVFLVCHRLELAVTSSTCALASWSWLSCFIISIIIMGVMFYYQHQHHDYHARHHYHDHDYHALSSASWVSCFIISMINIILKIIITITAYLHLSNHIENGRVGILDASHLFDNLRLQVKRAVKDMFEYIRLYCNTYFLASSQSFTQHLNLCNYPDCKQHLSY